MKEIGAEVNVKKMRIKTDRGMGGYGGNWIGQ